ncbi:MAG TPA: alkaline phosphatase family protein, partial [Paralcaligenes sp.]
FSEHPKWTPAYGASYIARVLDALTSNPLVWSKTVLFVLYDENDGFFDHVVPPQPPVGPGQGKSTVAFPDELHTVVNPLHDPAYERDGLPYGLGPRVPMTVISPWSKGGFVCSQVFDHTSVIRFIERRFGVVEPTISAWRRAVCGDLSAALDFTRCDQTIPILPDTGGYRALVDKQCSVLPKPEAPAAEIPAFQAQEPGIRPARPLPYDLHVRDSLDLRNKRLRLRFDNRGSQGVHFWAYADDTRYAPRHYTVEAQKSLSDDFPTTPSGNYAWTIYGPNGFVRIIKGAFSSAASSDMARLGVQPLYDRRKDVLLVEVRNQSAKGLSVRLTDVAYGNPEQEVALAPASTHLFSLDVKNSGYWYDAALFVTEYSDYIRRFAGHIETGRASCTDPAARAPVLI